MNGIRLLAAIVGVATSIGCLSPALAGWHNSSSNWRERALYDGRSMSIRPSRACRANAHLPPRVNARVPRRINSAEPGRFDARPALSGSFAHGPVRLEAARSSILPAKNVRAMFSHARRHSLLVSLRDGQAGLSPVQPEREL